MSSKPEAVRAFLDRAPAVLVEVASARGSTPREAGAWMLVSADRIHGTIGGGQLEFMAIDKAREMLGGISCADTSGGDAITPPPRSLPPTSTNPSALWGGVRGGATFRKPPETVETLSIPLGPEIGQCCGGKVDVSVRLVDEPTKADLLERARAEDEARPGVYIFGGGHVGQALAAAFSLLPLRVTVIETRAEALDDMPAGVETRLTPVPEEMVRDAPAGSAFVVLTHDHALDFLIVAEALKRRDAAYIGMIGSKTKKATFRSWYLKTAGGSEDAFTRLVSPIGGDAVRDKRPAVIAALAAAEVMTALGRVAQGSTEAGAAEQRQG